MPKTRAPVLDGLVQIDRGPRPKAARWPLQDRPGKTKRNQSAVSTKGAAATPKSEVEGVPPSQPSSGCGGRRSQCGSPTIVSSHISFGREQPTCHSVEGGIEGCTSQIPGAPCGQADRFAQGVHRESQASQSHRGRHCLSSRADWLKPFLAQGSRCSRAVCRLLWFFCVLRFVSRTTYGP